jgi:hypothetical protein
MLDGQAFSGKLLSQHLADLRRSGLSDEQIQACGFYSLRDPVQINTYLRWRGGGERLASCLAIPFRDRQGNTNGYVRLKPDKPRKNKDGKLIRYESPKGQPNRAYFPPGTIAALSDPAKPLLITEGEKKAAEADQEEFPCIGLTGVYGWQQKRIDQTQPRVLIEDLAGIAWTRRQVTIIYDSDASEKQGVVWGEWHLAEALERSGAVVRVVRLPAGPKGAKQGLDDFLVAQGPEALRQLIATATPAVKPERTRQTNDDFVVDLNPWPEPLADVAYHGLAGDVVRLIGPHSEADPVAILVQLLVGFGSALGRTAHFVVESDVHYLNEFALLIGKTSKARKSTSWGHDRRLLEIADADFVMNHIVGGLSSGEGLIWAVRDPIKRRSPIKDKGRVTAYQDIEEDPGISDKRLLCYESEFAAVLRRIEGQQGNTLSAVLRQAWDGGDLRTLTKNSPNKATAPHIGVIAHITIEDLRRYLSATEQANGFGNRFAIFCLKRSKQLPEGGSVPQAEMTDLGQRLRKALTFGRSLAQLHRDDAARAVWREVYGPLSEGKPGLAGSMLARAEAHVMRFAGLYAILDHSKTIGVKHLTAALALWDYVEASVHWAFGDSLGDPLADELLRFLRAAGATGVSRTDIRDFLGRNQSADRIGRALGLLLEAKLARRETQKGDGGRPTERWFAVGSGKNFGR